MINHLVCAAASPVWERRNGLEIIEKHIRTHELKRRKATTMAQVAVGGVGENRIIICSHAFDKQGQKTPRKEIDKALKRKRSYLERKASGQGFKIHTGEGQVAPRRQP